MSRYAEDFLAGYLASKDSGHMFWGTTEPVIFMTDSKLVTLFFLLKCFLQPN